MMIRPLGILLAGTSIAGLTADGVLALRNGVHLSEGTSALAMGALLLLIGAAARRRPEKPV